MRDLRKVPEVGAIKIVYVQREPSEIARSAYGTLVMFGENRSFEEIRPALEKRFSDVLAKLSLISSAGDICNHGIALNFDLLTETESLVGSFCGLALGLDLPKTNWPTLNASLDPQIIEAIRVWNRKNCRGVTIEDDSGDFGQEVFLIDPNINFRRHHFMVHLVQQQVASS